MASRSVWLFQYGSNMDPERLNSRNRLNGEARSMGVARLNGWGIRFDLYSKKKENRCGVTDVVPSKREHVMGILYKVSYRVVVAPRGQRSRMDEIEGAGLDRKSNYKRKKIMVRFNRKEVQARTYIGTTPGKERFRRMPPQERRVSQNYFNYLLAGADKFHFPRSYVTYLRHRAGPLK